MFQKLRGRSTSARTTGRRRRGNTDRTFASAPLNGGVLGCQVLDSGERPLAGATVTVFDWLERRVAHAETDPFGYFFATLPRGTYRINVIADGYVRARFSHEMWKGDRAPRLQIKLEPDAGEMLPKRGRWEIDPEHSAVRFVAQHIGMSRVHGQFGAFRGHIEVADSLEDSYAEVSIDAASIDTNNSTRDAHLRSSDFLDVERYPYLHFRSNGLTHFAGSRWTVDGELTLHGLTRSVQLDASYHGVRTWNGTRIGCTAVTELHREHFTLNWQQMAAQGIAVVGSRIEISLEVQAVLQE